MEAARRGIHGPRDHHGPMTIVHPEMNDHIDVMLSYAIIIGPVREPAIDPTTVTCALRVTQNETGRKIGIRGGFLSESQTLSGFPWPITEDRPNR